MENKVNNEKSKSDNYDLVWESWSFGGGEDCILIARIEKEEKAIEILN